MITREDLLSDLEKVVGSEVIQKMNETPQCLLYHPEGSVLEHTILVMRNVAEDVAYLGTYFETMYVVAMVHDIGKITHTKVDSETGKITAYGHEEVAPFWLVQKNVREAIEEFYPDCDIELARGISYNHMRAHLYNNHKMSNPHKRKAFEDLPYFTYLLKFAEYDSKGKTKLS